MESSRAEAAEAIVVGAGHNGLICAAYLARAGVDTLVLEARDTVGGCASTVADLGARFNICSCDHTMIRAMPIIDELELADHGLSYLEAEPSFLFPFHDRSDPWALFPDAERTLDAIAASRPDQLDGYRRYLSDATAVAEVAIEVARRRVRPRDMIAGATRARRIDAIARLLRWSRRSATQVLGEYFDDWHMVLPAVGIGPTVWGVSPDVPGTGLAALGYATRHVVRTGRPVGGSGALTDSTRAALVAAGGRVRTGARVAQILVEADGVRGVELAGGERIEAPIVVGACDPRAVLVDWLHDPPPAARALIDRFANQPEPLGYEAKLDLIVDRVPRWAGLDRLQAAFPQVDFAEPTVMLSPDPDELAQAHRLRAEGKVARRPSMMINAPSVLDAAMAPDPARHPDSHVFSIEVLFTPYDLPGGWPNSGEPDRWIDIVDDLLDSDLRASLGPWRAMTPDRYESEFHMPRGYAPSYAASPLATLVGRRRELSRHRTPIPGLYLSGAATWPGAGIFGAAGRNAAHRVLRERRLPRAGSARRALLSRSVNPKRV